MTIGDSPLARRFPRFLIQSAQPWWLLLVAVARQILSKNHLTGPTTIANGAGRDGILSARN
jgi:hypothetical protein